MANPNPRMQPSLEQDSSAGERPRLAVIAVSGDRKTKVSDIPDGRHATKVMPTPGGTASPGGGSPGGAADTRRIVGVIVTYSWRPEGQLFVVREGKNYIGADRVSSEPDHRLCHILIRDDPKMSAEHALILCRHGRYDIIDEKSSNGTFLGDELVPLQGTDLPNYAQLRTGSTVWTFIKIEPPESTERRSAPHPSPDDEPAPPDRRPTRPVL